MKTSVVIGLCYGDCGKGSLVNWLADDNSLVVRFNGGQQAGHTVVQNGYRNVFSSFGSGTLKGASTYISEYCTINPQLLYEEWEHLEKDRGIVPSMFIHPLAMITTPFDVEHNRNTERINQHGSVGMGVGSTIKRHQETGWKIHAMDFKHPYILRDKARQVAKYYKFNEADGDEWASSIRSFFFRLTSLQEILGGFEHIIFEGAQGIMLDMDFGYFPHVTRSNTTSKNAMKIIEECHLPKPEIYYIMRSYATRHGKGPLRHEFTEEHGYRFGDKTNVVHKWQGNFRQGWHSIGELKYALSCDTLFSGQNYTMKNLAITCLDQTEGQVMVAGELNSPAKFCDNLEIPFNRVLKSSSENGNFVDVVPTREELVVAKKGI